jgi:hypothetical protein
MPPVATSASLTFLTAPGDETVLIRPRGDLFEVPWISMGG